MAEKSLALTNDVMEKLISSQNFTPVEILGFIRNPNLAIKAGICLGYDLALSGMMETLKTIVLKKEV